MNNLIWQPHSYFMAPSGRWTTKSKISLAQGIRMVNWLLGWWDFQPFSFPWRSLLFSILRPVIPLLCGWSMKNESSRPASIKQQERLKLYLYKQHWQALVLLFLFLLYIYQLGSIKEWIRIGEYLRLCKMFGHSYLSGHVHKSQKILPSVTKTEEWPQMSL